MTKPKTFMTLLAVAVGVLAVSLLVTGCPETATESQNDGSKTDNPSGDDQGKGDGDEGTATDWRDVELTDVRNGETFTINSLKGKSVVLENMAVWCTTCLSQQKQMETAMKELGDSAVLISLDIDPNERSKQLADHVNRHEFDWAFAIDPNGAIGSQLAAEYGINVLNPPSTPIIVIDPEGNAELLRLGKIKSADEIVDSVS